MEKTLKSNKIQYSIYMWHNPQNYKSNKVKKFINIFLIKSIRYYQKSLLCLYPDGRSKMKPLLLKNYA